MGPICNKQRLRDSLVSRVCGHAYKYAEMESISCVRIPLDLFSLPCDLGISRCSRSSSATWLSPHLRLHFLQSQRRMMLCLTPGCEQPSHNSRIYSDRQCSNTLGYLQVSVGHDIIGYVSRQQNSYGEYIGVSPDDDSNDVSHRLLVVLDVSATGPTNLLTHVGTS
jgi:hypothetical protein